MVMPPFQSIPSIRVDLLDGSLRSLSSSSTLDIRDVIMSQVKLLPDLLAGDFLFDDADDALCSEDGHLPDVPSFPAGRRPPLFILQAHRMRLPFPIRQEAFELGDLCIDEDDAYPLLTAPTIPRMKLMIKEQLYVQKWADNLTSDSPPKHIPWSCDKPAAERKWVAEGSIFPASDMAQTPPKQCAANQQLPSAHRTNRWLAPAPHSSMLNAFSTIRPLSESAVSRSRVPVRSTGVDSRMLCGETPCTPTSTAKISQVPPLPTLLHSGHSNGTTVTRSDMPLATRRGKSSGGLVLKGSVIEQLEYPDIPTAFRGSPTIWSPQTDALSVPTFTDHQSMLFNLKLKGAALGSSALSYDPGNSCLSSGVAHSALNVDECVLTRGPFADILGPVNDEASNEIVAEPSIFLLDDPSTPARSVGSTVRHGFVSRPPSTPVFQSPVKRSSDPPGTPLPPRPALVNPSTPPHVRGILKKVKSVRFEDGMAKESHETPPIITSRASPERPTPQHPVVMLRRPCTPMPMTIKSRGLVKEPPMPGRSTEDTNLAPRPRPFPKRIKATRKLESAHNSNNNPLKASKSVTTSIERPCRVTHVKRSTGPLAVPQTQGRQKGLPFTEADVRRRIEGTTKSRISTPLRNIFRFR